MPSHLIINSIILPPSVDAPCPTEVTVLVQNIGNSTARGAFFVCLEIRDNIENRPVIDMKLLQKLGEGGLPSGQVLKVNFDVSFPCAPSVQLTVIADCDPMVFVIDNKGKGDPSSKSTISVALTPRPWLVTELKRLGLRDSGGIVSFEPVSLCPGSDLVVEGEVRNAGCADAPASVAVMRILVSGQQIFAEKRVVPKLLAGATHPLQFVTKVPSATPTITVEICADTTGAVTGQCNQLRLCDSRAASVVGVSVAPSATLAVKSAVVPGERPIVTWQLQNSCVDLGLVTARVLFAGTELYKSQGVHIGLQSSGGELEKIVPPTPAVPPNAVAAGLWVVGTKALDLVVDGSGPSPASASATATLTVVRESVGPSWWTWSGPPAGSSFLWKVPYGLSGTFMHLGQSRLTPTAVTLREHDIATTGPAADVLRPAIQSLGPLVPGAILPVSWPPFVQTWRWFDIISMLPSGPLSKTFDYTAEFPLQDDFGNSYPAVSSAALRVVVDVPKDKFYFAFASYEGQLTGTALLVMAGLAAAGIITILGAAALAAAAGTAFTIALALRKIAEDPPIADFDFDEPVPMPERSTALVRLGPEFAGLRGLLELVNLVGAYSQALSRIEGKLLGARVHGRAEAVRSQREAYVATMALLERAAAALPATAAQATEEFARLLAPALAQMQTSLEQLRQGEVSDVIRRVWSLTELPAEDVEKLPAIVAADRLPPLSELPKQLAAAAADAARETLAAAAERLSEDTK
jgi:hypothetical protein